MTAPRLRWTSTPFGYTAGPWSVALRTESRALWCITWGDVPALDRMGRVRTFETAQGAMRAADALAAFARVVCPGVPA